MVKLHYFGPYSALNKHIGPKMSILAILLHYKPIMVQQISVNLFNPTTLMVWSSMVKYKGHLTDILVPKWP